MPAWKKGETGNPNGRPPVELVLTTARVRKDFLDAFVRLGGIDGLVAWGKKNRGEFYRLLVRMLPRELEVAGKDGGPLETRVIVEFVGGDKS